LRASIGLVASRQFGLITGRQALELGMAPHMIRRQAQAGRWKELYPGVYCMAGSPASFEQATLAAVLASGPGAAASHRSAGGLLRLRGVSAVLPEVTVPYTRNPSPLGVRIYRSRTMCRADMTKVGPIPVTSATRTLIDLAAVLGAESVENALDDALQRRLTSIGKLRARMEGAHKGVTGVRLLRELLTARSKGHLGESAFENRLRRVLRASGLPAPTAQCVVRDADGTFIARVDLAYPKFKVAIEADGYAFHSGRREFERDRERQNRLVNAGWRVLRFTPTQLDSAAATVADALSVKPK
jgi:very-short-patch-repair endonuclease